jgi:uncharacterized protein YjbI with pentapeptide repeats
MNEDDIENDDMDDEEAEEDLPEFRITELTQNQDHEQGDHRSYIRIQERTIVSLAEIVAFANKEHLPLSVEECVLKQVRLHAASSDMSFEDSLFTERTLFNKAVFVGNLEFWETSLDEGADFDGTIFKKEVSFDECLFGSEVSFVKAVVEKKAAFTSCVFEGDIQFDNTRFAGDVDFSESTFRGKVSFRDTLFEKSVDLTNTTFERTPETDGSNLAEARERQRVDPEPPKKQYMKKRKKKAEFNPWHTWDKASKKTMTRRHLLRGLFRFLPEEKEE